MKWLLILLFSIIPFMSLSQEDSTYIELDTSIVHVDYVLVGLILDEFLEDAVKNGLDSSIVTNHLKMLDGIYMDSLDDRLGVTVCKKDSLSPIGIRGIIFLDQELFLSYSVLKLTVYHELGHWFGIGHTRGGIMKENSENVFKVLYKWDKEVKVLMKMIKKNKYSYPDLGQ